MHKNIFLLGVKISLSSKEEILEIIEKDVIQITNNRQQVTKKPLKPLVIFTPNPEIVMFAQKHSWFKKIVNSGQINIPDGAGLVLGAKLLGYPIKERISGADLTRELVSLASREKIVIGLIGGFDNLALSALECQRKQYPNLKSWAEDGPRVKCQMSPPKADPPRAENVKCQMDCGSWDIDKFVKRVKERQTRILLVGFGFPKQELFIKEIAPKLDNIILMAVGGTFAYLSGRISRAPKVLQSLGLEWLYRLYKEPWRIKRQLVLLEFVVRVLIHKIIKT